jgi:hypothetical protein
MALARVQKYLQGQIRVDDSEQRQSPQVSGMTLDYTIRGQVKITIFDYVEEILTAFDKADPK